MVYHTLGYDVPVQSSPRCVVYEMAKTNFAKNDNENEVEKFWKKITVILGPWNNYTITDSFQLQKNQNMKHPTQGHSDFSQAIEDFVIYK